MCLSFTPSMSAAGSGGSADHAVLSPLAKVAPPIPNFAAIAKAFRRLIAMLIFSANSDWFCIWLSIFKLIVNS
jgi:hypothetical protein